MKRMGFLAVFCVFLAGMLVSCGGKAETSAKSDKPTIGVAIYKYDDTFMSGVRNAIENAGKGKAEILMVDSQNSQPEQSNQVDQFIAKGANAMAINVVDRNAAKTIIEKAKSAGIPIVFFNREPFPEDLKSYDKAYYVGAKAEQSGTMQGQIVVDYFKKHPEADKNGDGVIQYVMLKGEPGHQDAELRTEYSVKALKDAGLKVEKVAEDTAMWNRVQGQEKMAAFLAAHGNNIEVVLCNNDDMALGAVEALKAAGYFKDGKYLPVVGVDATAPALQAIEEGTLLGTVLNDAKNQGNATFSLSNALAKGQAASASGLQLVDDRYVWVPYQMVTPENYRQFK